MYQSLDNKLRDFITCIVEWIDKQFIIQVRRLFVAVIITSIQ